MSVETHRKEIKNILRGEDARKLVIVGPCSAWPYEEVLEYARRISDIEKDVRNHLKIVMRVYTQKPRTTLGWKGPLIQPDPDKKPDLEKGKEYTLNLMKEIAGLELSLADEVLFIESSEYLLEYLSWTAIGARTSESQPHRLFASSVDIPVGIKNPTSGSLKKGVESVFSAQHANTGIINGKEVQTEGNPCAHLVLRGGADGPNYDADSIKDAVNLMRDMEIKNPSIIVDASHDNSKVSGEKRPERQLEIPFEVQEAVKTMRGDIIKNPVKGFMIESFLTEESGITDPGLNWTDTEKLIENLAKADL